MEHSTEWTPLKSEHLLCIRHLPKILPVLPFTSVLKQPQIVDTPVLHIMFRILNHMPIYPDLVDAHQPFPQSCPPLLLELQLDIRLALLLTVLTSA